MKWAAALCVLLATGCASQGRDAVNDPARPELVGIACVDCPDDDEVGAPSTAPPPAQPVVVSEPPVVVPEMESECVQALRLFEAGEHKPAVDSLDAVLRAGASCDDDVLGAVGEAQRVLAEADAMARRGLEQRAAGEIAAARSSFREALDVYPKYYWVQKLEQDLPPDPSPALDRLRQQAAAALAAGRSEEALELLEQAAVLPVAGPELSDQIAGLRTQLTLARIEQARQAQRSGDLERAVERTERAIELRPTAPALDEVVDFARRLGLSLFSAGELVKARDLWGAALSLDQANDLLRQYLDEVEARLRTLDAIKDNGD